MSALHQASLVGNVDIMKILLDNGAQPDLKDVRGKQSHVFQCRNQRTLNVAPQPLQLQLLKGRNSSSCCQDAAAAVLKTHLLQLL